MTQNIRFVLFFILICFNFSVGAQEVLFKLNGKTIIRYPLEKIRLRVQSLSIQHFQRKMLSYEKYSAFSMPTLLDHIYGDHWKTASTLNFSNKQKDTYNIPVKRFLKKKSYLAYGRSDGHRFMSLNEKGKFTDLKPFYLIWDHKKRDGYKDINVTQILEIDLKTR